MYLKDEIRDYLDSEGFVTPDFRPQTLDTSGNLILYTSIYYIFLVLLGEARDEDFKVYYCLMRSCQVSDKRVLIKGLFNRSPRKKDQEGPDDYIAISACARVMCEPFSQEILDYGRLNRFIYNNESPGKFTFSSWFGRMPQVVAHFYLSCFKVPGILKRLWWFFSVISAGKDSTSWILSWLMILTAKESGFIFDLAADIWKWRLKRSRFKRMKSVFADHLGERHAITRVCWF